MTLRFNMPWEGPPIEGPNILNYTFDELKSIARSFGGRQRIRSIIINSSMDQIKTFADYYKIPWDGLSKGTFLNALMDYFESLKLPAEELIRHDIVASLAEESEAITNYTGRAVAARQVGREDIAQMYEHIKKEEEEHYKEIWSKL